MLRWAALFPHPPILVPEVGRGREREAASTLEGLERILRRLRDRRPEGILLLSPHARQVRGALALFAADRLEGDLSAFGAPQAHVEATGAPQVARRLAERLAPRVPLRLYGVETLPLDHASLIPLLFLLRTWGELPPVIVAGPIGLSPEQSHELGLLTASSDPLEGWGLLASGDLSHRLLPGAPAGYSPRARSFDESVTRALAEGDASRLLSLDPAFVEEAGECGLRSVLAMIGAVGGPSEVLSYEGPFGVGYALAVAFPGEEASLKGSREEGPASEEEPPVPLLARRVVENLLASGEAGKSQGEDPERSIAEILARAPALFGPPAPCFVSLHGPDGSLRGCIGTLLPTRASLGEEIRANAIAAATRDPRFPPVSRSELRGLHFSVDVLEPSEPVESLEELDPRVYGVIVSKGFRRGVLLPDLEGVDTPEVQVRIALRKAGIGDPSGVRIERFRVRRYEEAHP